MGREGLWLEGRVFQCNWGEGGPSKGQLGPEPPDLHPGSGLLSCDNLLQGNLRFSFLLVALALTLGPAQGDKPSSGFSAKILRFPNALFPRRRVQSLVTRIAATSNRKSLATAIATQKNHCDSENTCKTAISLRFLREKLATSKLRLAIASDL